MSKKHTITTVFAICIVAVIATVLVLENRNAISKKAAAPAEALSAQLEKACQIFPDDKAKTLLGSQAVKSDGNNATSSSDDIAVSECAYIDQPQSSANGDSQKRASLVVRTARTEAGARANKTVFSTLPAGSFKVEGYGDAAFWSADFGQLNILKGDNWYILEYGSQVPTKRTENDAKQFAGLLADNL